MGITLQQAARLNDHSLVNALKHTRGRELGAVRDFLVYLAEVDVRRVFLELGYSSLFTYLVEHLGFCESGAAARVAACRAIRTFPEILEAVASGQMHLTGLRMVAKHLTESNVEKVMADCSGKSKAWIEGYVATQLGATVAPRREVVRVFAEPVVAAKTTEHAQGGEPAFLEKLFANGTIKTETPVKQKKVVRISLTLDEEDYEELVHAKNLSGENDFTAVVKTAIKHYVRKKDATKTKTKLKDTRAASQPKTRYIPKAVKAIVRGRDKHQCTFVGVGGNRCGEKRGLHFDHVQPYALGGDNSAENLRLLCAAHNRHAARKTFPDVLFRKCDVTSLVDFLI